MIYTALFLVCMTATAIAMGLTLWTGHKAQRRAHLARALTTVAMLVLTVLFAWLMSVYERVLPEREMAIHRIFSITVAVAVPLVAITGIKLWRQPSWRQAHRAMVGLLVVATVGALGTGLWVLWLSTAR